MYSAAHSRSRCRTRRRLTWLVRAAWQIPFTGAAHMGLVTIGLSPESDAGVSRWSDDLRCSRTSWCLCEMPARFRLETRSMPTTAAAPVDGEARDGPDA
jgi:hypothetical protein